MSLPSLPANFDPSRHGPAILLCFVHWCGHCRDTMPVMEKVAHALGSVVPVFSVDGDAFPDLMKAWNVKGYPTILMASGQGDITEYEGPRTFDGITAFACRVAPGKRCAMLK